MADNQSLFFALNAFGKKWVHIRLFDYFGRLESEKVTFGKIIYVERREFRRWSCQNYRGAKSHLKSRAVPEHSALA